MRLIALILAVGFSGRATAATPPPIDVGRIDGSGVSEVIDAMATQIDAGAESIHLTINSPGGSVSAGFRLSQSIERSLVPVICTVDGMAASMAFFVLQSCDVRLVTKRSILMAHGPSLGDVAGSAHELRQALELLRVLERAMAEHEAHKLKISVDEFLRRTHETEWWFGWHEAEQVGAVDACI